MHRDDYQSMCGEKKALKAETPLPARSECMTSAPGEVTT